MTSTKQFETDLLPPKDTPNVEVKTGQAEGTKCDLESAKSCGGGSDGGARFPLKIKIFKCTDCLSAFSLEETDDIVHHLLSHAEKKGSFICVLCAEKQSSLAQLRFHLLWHVGLPKFASLYCASIRTVAVPIWIEKRFENGQIFGVESGLELPVGYHYVENAVPTDDAKPSSSTKLLADQIVESVTNQGNKLPQNEPPPPPPPHPQDAEMSTTFLGSRKKLVEVDGPPRRCPLRRICKASFKNSKLLVDHLMSLEHCPETTSFVCPICNKIMTKSRDLRWHITLHLRYKRYLCGTCSQTFTTFANFNAHIC